MSNPDSLSHRDQSMKASRNWTAPPSAVFVSSINGERASSVTYSGWLRAAIGARPAIYRALRTRQPGTTTLETARKRVSELSG